jgi:putative drug exporter of the RND superfamily
VIVVWLVLAAGMTVVSHSIGRDTSDNLSIPGSGANAAKNILNDSLPQQANGTNPVVFKANKGTLDSGANKQAVDQTVDSLKKAPHVSKVVSPYDDNDEALSKDKKIGYA